MIRLLALLLAMVAIRLAGWCLRKAGIHASSIELHAPWRLSTRL
jgi:hypothetical protein